MKRREQTAGTVMKQTLIGGLVALALGGCDPVVHGTHQHFAGSDVVAHGSHQHRVIGKADAVTITNVNEEWHDFAAANEYCEARGKTSRFIRLVNYRAGRRVSRSAQFECISPSTALIAPRAPVRSGLVAYPPKQLMVISARPREAEWLQSCDAGSGVR